MLRHRTIFILLLSVGLFVESTGRVSAQCCIDQCKSTVTANSGVLLVCPKGDGDFLTDAVGGVNCQITLTVKDNANRGIAAIPETDMWLIGCNNDLLLCGGSEGSAADHATDADGATTFSRALHASGCDVGLYVIVQGIIIQGPCLTPKCLSIASRSPDYKSAGAPGPAPCGGDLLCPDGGVTNADFSWFTTHYPTAANPGASYLACADYAPPLGAPIGLGDFSKFTIHFYMNIGHRC